MATLAHQKNRRQEGIEYAARILDLDFIRRKLPIETVARLLEIEVNHNHFAHCFREDRHANGDQNPSLHFLTRKNCATCFGCGGRAMSTIDFVIAVLEYRNLPHTFRDAIRWFEKEFDDLPTLRGRPAGLVTEKPFRVGVGGELEDLMRSGVYRSLSDKAVRILTVIQQLHDANLKARLPYNTLRRITGIGSKATIKAGLDELENIHIIEPRKIHGEGTVYLLTPRSPELVELINQTYQAQREELQREVAYYREAKLARRRAYRSNKTTPEPTPTEKH